MPHDLIMFAGLIALASVAPGPNTILVVQHSLTFGISRIAPTILGNLTFLLLVATTAAAGVGTLLKNAPTVHAMLQVVGAGYLIFIALKSFRGALASEGTAGISPIARQVTSARSRFAEAFLTSATNVQAIFFLSALFPSFLSGSGHVIREFIILFCVLLTVVGTVHLGYALCATFVRSYGNVGRARRIAQAMAGLALLCFALAVIFDVLSSM